MSSTMIRKYHAPLLRVLVALAVSAAMLLPAAPAPASAATLVQKWVTILCDFADPTGVTPRDPAEFRDQWDGTAPGLDHYWREASYGAIGVDGQRVVGPFSLSNTLASYEPYNDAAMIRLRDDCIAKADPQVDFRQYEGIAVVHNDGGHIGFDRGYHYQLTLDGLSQEFKVLWLHTRSDMSQWAHEMGHSFGLFHSSGLGFPNEPYEFPRSEYMSDWDLMSGRGSPCGFFAACYGVHPLSAQKDFLNWIPADRKVTVARDTAATVSLERLALPGASGELMVKVPIVGSTTQYYTVEARKLAGYDDYNNNSHIPGEGVIISKVDTQTVPRVRVVDSDNEGGVNDESAIWSPGETYTDVANAITIKVLRETATGYDVLVSNQPFISIDNASVTEPAPNGSASANVTVRLSRPSGSTILVDFATRASDAQAGADFQSTAGSLGFAAGTTTRVIQVPILADPNADGGERFFVDLANPRDAQILDGTGQVTIQDPALPTLAINNASVTEGDSGTRNMAFSVTLSRVPSQAVSVNFASSSSGATATAGTDYTAVSGSLQFAYGATSLTRTVNVPVRGDFADEANETLKVNLSAVVGATLADAQGVGTIVDDDLPIAEPPPCPPSLPNCQPQ